MPKQRKNRARAGNNAPNAADADADADADAAAQLKPKRTRKSVPLECPSQRTSVYRGVTRHRWTGRFEAHLWDKNTWSETQRKKKGRQVYLGAYGDEEAAARAYDLAALKYWGRDTVLNFPLSSYDEELREMEGQSREEYIGSLRRKSTGFSRGVSKYRGVARHHHNGKWEARIGRVFGNKYLYLGTYATQEEAAVAYDVAAIQHRGLNAVTNFDVSRYIKLHHRCRAGDADGLDATNEIPGQLLRDLGQDPTIDLDKDMADAAFHDERQRPDRTADHLLPQGRPLAHAASTTSALGLLPQSSRFKEVIEREAASESGTGSPSSSWCSPSPPTPPTQQQQQPEYSGGASSARCSFFPDDVQTYFGCQDDDGVDYAEVDALLFGDLGAYAGPNSSWTFDLNN